MCSDSSAALAMPLRAQRTFDASASALEGRTDSPDPGPAGISGVQATKTPENLSDVIREISSMKMLLNRAVSGQVRTMACSCTVRGVLQTKCKITVQVNKRDLELMIDLMRQSVSQLPGACAGTRGARNGFLRMLSLECIVGHLV